MLQRAHGTLAGLAIGDALGLPTQMLARRRVAELFPVFTGFEAGPEENEIGGGQPAASVTDDTQQALIVARLLIEGQGHVDPLRFVEELLAWSQEAEKNGTEQLGPSSRRALELLQHGVPVEKAGRRGDTNGSAMRIMPVGIAFSSEPLDLLLDHVEEVCRPTHFTGLGIGGAAAVATVISAGINGASFADALVLGKRAARLGQQRGYYTAGADLAERIVWALDLTSQLDDASALDALESLVGTGVTMQETIPAAFVLASRWSDQPWRACLEAAYLGGDSDTIAAIVGSMLGACCGVDAFPSEALATVERVNNFHLEPIAQDLLNLRASVGTTHFSGEK